MYIVLMEFADLQDGKHVYKPGDEYPRKGYSPTPERVDELLTNKNRLRTPLIQTEEERAEQMASYQKRLRECGIEDEEEAEPEAVEEPKPKRGRKPKKNDD